MSSSNNKYNLTLNYAKIRNSKNKNKSSIDMDKEASDEQQINSPDQIAKIQKEMENKLSSSYVNLNENKKSMLYYNTTRETKNDNVINNLFDDNKFNRENLEYINTLLKAKEVEKEKSPLPINQYNIKISSSNINMNNLNGSNHKKSSNSVDQPIAERSKPLTEKFNNSVDNPTSKNWNPFAKKTIKEEKNENDSSQKQTQNPEVNELKEKGQENSTKRERIKSLFEQNNKKFAETNEKKNVNNSVSHHQRDSSYSFRTNKKEEDMKSSPNFLNFIQYYIDYFNNNSYQHEKNEYSKSNHAETKSKEIAELKNENQFLKQQLEKFEYKFKEIASSKKNFHSEVSSYKKRDEENQNIIRYQAQEINKLKNYIHNLHYKLKYTQEALAREKIEAENSMIALKKVLYKKMMKNSDFESQISNIVQNHIPTKDKYSRSKEKTSRGHNYGLKDSDKAINNFYQPYNQETTESYFDKSINSSIKSSNSQEEIFAEQFNTPYLKEKSKDYSNYALHRKRKSANFNTNEISNKNQLNKTQSKKKNVSQNEEIPWKDQIIKKDNSNFMKRNKAYKQNEFDNMGEDSFSMNEIQNASMSLVNSD